MDFYEGKTMVSNKTCFEPDYPQAMWTYIYMAPIPKNGDSESFTICTVLLFYVSRHRK